MKRTIRLAVILTLAGATAVALSVPAAGVTPNAPAIPTCPTRGDAKHCWVQAEMDFKQPHAHGVGAYFTEPSSLPSIGNDAYSIAQLSLEDTRPFGLSSKVIEFGWAVNPTNWRDKKTHLFIALRFSPKGLCLIGVPNLTEPYKPCPDGVYVQVSSSLHPGSTVGNTGQPRMYHMGYHADNKAWWIQYGNEWLGYVNESYFNAPNYVEGFAKGRQIKWFGEVAYQTSWCTPMGNGWYGSDRQSASISGMFYEVMESGESVAKRASTPPPAQSDSRFWNADHYSRNENGIDGFHYGGPQGSRNECGVG